MLCRRRLAVDLAPRAAGESAQPRRSPDRSPHRPGGTRTSVGAAAWAIVPATLLCAAVAGGCAGRSDTLPQHYADPTAMIEVFEDPARDSWQLPDRVIRALPIPSNAATIADIGAGSGYFTRRLAREVPGGKVYAVDVDDRFQRYLIEQREAWGTPNIEPHLAHYEDPLLPSAEIDLVFTCNTYPYIRERVAYFRKVRDALRPGGALVVIHYRPDATPPDDSAPEPKFRIDEPTTLAELEAAGFVLDRQETFLPHQYLFVFRPAP
jgi:predicted methyltransferase